MKGRPYYQIGFDPQVLFAIARGIKPLPPEALINSHVEFRIHWLWNICERCWEVNPEERTDISSVVMHIEEIRELLGLISLMRIPILGGLLEMQATSPSGLYVIGWLFLSLELITT